MNPPNFFCYYFSNSKNSTYLNNVSIWLSILTNLSDIVVMVTKYLCVELWKDMCKLDKLSCGSEYCLTCQSLSLLILSFIYIHLWSRIVHVELCLQPIDHCDYIDLLSNWKFCHALNQNDVHLHTLTKYKKAECLQ